MESEIKGKGKPMDHERINIHQSTMSCGVMELSRISEDTADAVYALASRLYHPARGNPCAFFIWSNLRWADDLGDFVTKNEFGHIATVGPQENPRTGNQIYVHLWSIDHEMFKKWYIAQRVARMKKAGT